MSDYLQRLEDQLAELTEQRAHLAAVRSQPWRRRLGVRSLVPAMSVAVAIAVAAVVLTSVRHHASNRVSTPVAAARTTPGAMTAPGIPHYIREFATQIAILRRPQTPKDRSLPTVLRRAVRLGHLGSGFDDALQGTIPSLTRYAETISGGREVFLTVADQLPASIRAAIGGSRAGHVLILRVVIVQPDGSWAYGQPVLDGGGGANDGSLYFEARRGDDGCAGGPRGTTYISVVPDRVGRIEWQFPRQDRYGYVYKSALTVNIEVRQNLAVTTVDRASCDRPRAVTLYGPDGREISHIGSTAGLDAITRPIRHGNPFAGMQALARTATRRARRST